jgi:hypothetical protein
MNEVAEVSCPLRKPVLQRSAGIQGCYLSAAQFKGSAANKSDSQLTMASHLHF